MIALAVDVGGSHVTCAAVEDSVLLASETFPATSTDQFANILSKIVPCLLKMAREARVQTGDCTAVVLSFCGLADARTGKVLSTSSKYDDAPHIALSVWAKQAFGLPLLIENDARMALLCEHYTGAARGCDDVVMLTLGTGVGGAAMIGGRVLRGKHSQAGCLGGHFPVQMDGRLCGCGGMGCVEAEASTSALGDILESWPEYSRSSLAGRARSTSFAALCTAVDEGDRVATEVFEHCVRVWGHGAIAMIHAFDPAMLVVGGGVMHRAELVLPGIERLVTQRAWTPWGKVAVRRSELGGSAPLLGAIPLIQECL